MHAKNTFLAIFLSITFFVSCQINDTSQVQGIWKSEISETEYYLLEVQNDNFILSNYVDEVQKYIMSGKVQILNSVLVFDFASDNLSDSVIGLFSVEISLSGSELILTQIEESSKHIMTFVKTEEYSPYPISLQKPILSASSNAYQVVTLSWERDYSADSYTIQRSTTADGPFVEVAKDIVASSWIDTDPSLITGATFYYQIQSIKEDRVLNRELMSPFSDVVIGSTLPFNASVGTVENLSLSFISKEIIQTTSQLSADEQTEYPFSDLSAHDSNEVLQVLNGVRLAWDSSPNADYYILLVKDGDNWIRYQQISGAGDLISVEPFLEFFDLKLGSSYQFKILPMQINPTGTDIQGIPSKGVGIDAIPPSFTNALGVATWDNSTTKGHIDIRWSSMTGFTEFRIMSAILYGENIEYQNPIVKNGDSNSHRVEGIETNEKTHQFGFWGKYSFVSTVETATLVDDSAEGNPNEFTFEVPDNSISTDCWVNLNRTLHVGFWLSELNIENKENSVKLSWSESPDTTVTEYKIYRQMSEKSWVDNDYNISFAPSILYYSVDDITDISVETFSNTTYNEVTKMLYLGSVTKNEDLVFEDNSLGHMRLQPASYSYYVIANNSFIHAEGYRTAISDREFIQLVSRHLDRMFTNMNEDDQTWNSMGTFSTSLKWPGGIKVQWVRDYNINNFKSDYLTLTTEGNFPYVTTDGMSNHESATMRDSGWKYNAAIWYYTVRNAKIKVTGRYEGTIYYNLSRNNDDNDRLGGARWSSFSELSTEKDFGMSSNNVVTQGHYSITRGSNPQYMIRWDEGLDTLNYYTNNNDFTTKSNEQEIKVEPNFTSDFVEWK